MSMMVAVECPVCGGAVDAPTDAIVGELIDCTDCGAELEVTSLQPALTVIEAPMSAEDWGE